jgi:opacity protein-like surface antigen
MPTLRTPLVLLVIASSISMAAAESQGNIAALVGWKWLDEESWGRVETQYDYGVSFSVGKRGWPVLFALDVLRSHRQVEVARSSPVGATDTFEGETLEVALGVRKYFKGDTVRPFLGGGIVGVSGNYDDRNSTGDSSPALDDEAVGLWFGGGVGFRLNPRTTLGLDLRWTEANASREAGPYGPDRRPTRSGIALAASGPRDQSRWRLGGLHLDVSLGFHW